MLQEYASERPAKSPGEWFSKRFPAQAEQYGPPMLECVETLLDQSIQVSPVALNEDFYAAVLGGDDRLGHHVVFYLPEQQFYFFDCRFGRYEPTSEQKLILLLSQYLIQCAADMPGDETCAHFIWNRAARRQRETKRNIFNAAGMFPRSTGPRTRHKSQNYEVVQTSLLHERSRDINTATRVAGPPCNSACWYSKPEQQMPNANQGEPRRETGPKQCGPLIDKLIWKN